MVDITLLGGQSVVDPVTERILTRSTRSIALLAFLVAHEGVPQSRSAIAGAFWPDSTESQALTNLRRELHQLRLVLGDDDALEVTGTHLAWHDGARHRVDLGTFLRERAAAAAATDDEETIRHGTAALAAYGGDLLPALDDPWLDDVRTQLRAWCAQTCDLVCAAAERAGRLDLAVEAMRRRIRLDPYEEPPYRRLIELQAAAGDRAGAVRTYHQLSGLLEAELGLQPDPRTTRLLDRITRTESSRSVTGPARAALLGRSAELAVLLDAWDRASAGRAGVVLVGGGAGVGKSRLVSELEARVRRTGAVVAASHCFESSGRISLAPVSAWLRAPGVAEVRDRVDHVWRREADRLLPDDRGGPAPTAAAPGPGEEELGGHGLWRQQRFFEGVARTLLAGDRPTLLVLDDLQWCDVETMHLVSAMLALFPRAPLLLAVTTRPDTRATDGGDGSASSWVAGLRHAGLLAETWLEPLDVDATAELAESLTGARPADPVQLHQATGGFPLFVVEAARAGLVDRPGGAPATGAWSAILRSRLRQASVPAQEVAGLAAALGRDFTLPVLLEASDLDADDLVLAVDELWRHRILSELGEGYDFSHDLLRAAAYDAVSRPRRWLLHRRLAEALEHLNTGHLDTVAAQLAEQHALAANHDQAIAHYLRAARASFEVFAHSEALDLLDRALVQVETLPPGRHRDESEIGCHVLAAQVLLALRGYTPPEMEHHWRRILEIAERLGRSEERVTALVGLFGTMFVRGRMREALAIGRRTVDLVEPGDARYGQAHFALAGAALHFGRCAEAHDAFGVALANLTREEFMSFLVRAPVFCSAWAAHAAWARNERDRAARLAREAIAESRSSGHIPSQALAFAYAAITHQLLGDREECARCAEAAYATCRRYRLSYYGEWGRILAGWCRGDPGEIRAGITTLRRSDAQARMPYWLALLADVTPDPAAAGALLE